MAKPDSELILFSIRFLVAGSGCSPVRLTASVRPLVAGSRHRPVFPTAPFSHPRCFPRLSASRTRMKLAGQLSSCRYREMLTVSHGSRVICCYSLLTECPTSTEAKASSCSCSHAHEASPPIELVGWPPWAHRCIAPQRGAKPPL